MLNLALGGGAVLALFLALYLGLSIKIEQGRLRITAQALMRGAAPPGTDVDVAPEWRGLLDDLRVVSRRQQQELADTNKKWHACQHDLAVGQARALAANSMAVAMHRTILSTLAEVERMLAGMPLQGAAQADRQARVRSSLEPLQLSLKASVASLETALQPVSALLKAAEMAPTSLTEKHEGRTHAAETKRAFVQTATRLAESMQLLGLNFRLTLERISLERDENPELASVVEDLEPLCAEAAVLQDQVRAAERTWFEPEPAPSAGEPSAWPLPGPQTRQVLVAFLQQAALELQTMTAALQQTHSALERDTTEWGNSESAQDSLRTTLGAMSQRLSLALQQGRMEFAPSEMTTPAPDAVIPSPFPPDASSRHREAQGEG
ncbi:hypothetical protein [Thiomonas sp. X19]|uniref:hypothetical protein n=1 Tax=Thiomonas sp. X19 TaxID=1050370 RepID=UPI0011BE27AB|nr:hypothetical protein [Thiomonas sp. X19]